MKRLTIKSQIPERRCGQEKTLRRAAKMSNYGIYSENLWKMMLRDAKSENFVSHWECGIQYPKCSIETKTVQRRIIDISAFFQISYRNAIHDEQYSGHGFRNLFIPKGKWKDHIFLKWFSAFLLTGQCITINWLNALI